MRARSVGLLLELAGIAAVGGTAGVVAWRAQRALWVNGLDPAALFELPKPGADLTVAAADERTWFVGTAVLCVAYVVLVVRARAFARSRALTVVALAVPTAAAVVLWWLPPTLSIDAYSYLSHGYLAAQPLRNPYVDPSASVGDSPYGGLLAAQGWLPVHSQSPYGPLWTTWERLVYAISGDDVEVGVRIVKLPALLGLLGSGVLTWKLLERLRPERKLTGTLLLLANPVLLVELAGDGHNDGVVLLAVLLALWTACRGSAVAAVAALGLGALVKYTPLLFLPAVLTHLLTTRRSGRGATLLRVAAALVVLAGVTVALYWPYWAGSATFDGLRLISSPVPSWSVAGWVADVSGSGDTPADLYGVPEFSPASLVLALAAGVCSLLATITSRTLAGLARSCLALAVVLALLLPTFWPWYTALPIGLAGLTPTAGVVAAAVVLTVGSRAVALGGNLLELGAVPYEELQQRSLLVGLTLPGLVAVLLVVGGWFRRGTAPTDPGPPRADERTAPPGPAAGSAR